MRIAIVGAGKVGTALGVRWLLADHEIAVARHGAPTEERHQKFLPRTPLMTAEEAVRSADVVMIGVPDPFIAGVCTSLRDALRAGQFVAHLSGAMGLDSLSAAGEAGASVLSIHPLQTFPDVESAIGNIPGSAMAITALDERSAALGEELAIDAGGRPFRLEDDMKSLYHAAAVFASNYLVAVAGQAATLFRAAGIADPVDAFLPLSMASIENVARLGPEAALTGPVVRGDAAGVRRNLEALAQRAPDAVGPYVALAGLALALAARSGRSTDEGLASIEEELARWR